MRRLHVTPEAAALLPASHLAQLDRDADNDDNVCVICGALIEGDDAELVVLHDARMVLARLAHPECGRSGAYGWEGTTAAVQALTLDPAGLDVATLLAWRRGPRPRALVLLEPRIQVSLDGGDEDWLARCFAEPMALTAANQPIARLQPPSAPGRVRDGDHGLELIADGLRVTIPAAPELRRLWREHADDGHAVVLVGRGLGIAGPEHQLLSTLDDALLSRPVWAGTVRVENSGLRAR